MSKKKLIGSLAALLSLSVFVGGVFAYLTDNGSVKNKFTVGKVDIEGKEPNWDPDDDGEEGGTAENIEPTESFEKDPQITNTGNNDAYVYIEVEVPVKDVIYANNKGERQNGGSAEHIELFEFDATGKVTQTLTDGKGTSEQNDKWIKLASKELNGKMVYTFGYSEVLTPGSTTDPLFNKITFANVVEGQLDEQELDVDVHYYAIQTVNTEDSGSNMTEKLKHAYNKYIAQNKSLDGAVVNDTIDE